MTVSLENFTLAKIYIIYFAKNFEENIYLLQTLVLEDRKKSGIRKMKY